MTHTCEPRRAGGATGSGNAVCLAADAAAEIAVPDDLEAQVRAYLAEHPDEPWEAAVASMEGPLP